MSEHGPRDRPPLWRRLGPAERAVALCLVIVAIGGLLLIADGLYIKAKAADFLPSSDATSLGSSLPQVLDDRRRASGPVRPPVPFLGSPLANAASLPR